MILIWKGWGPIVIAVGALALLVGAMVASTLGADGRASDLIFGVALIGGGVATWFLGKRMNRNMDRELVDPKTGQTVILRRDHSLFFVRVEYWGPVMVVFGAYLIIAGLLRAS